MSSPTHVDAKRTGGLLIYFLVIVSLQIFLLVVAVDGLIAHDAGPARAAAVLSVILFLIALMLRWFLRDD